MTLADENARMAVRGRRARPTLCSMTIKERLSLDLSDRIRVGLWKLAQLQVATVRRLLGEHLGRGAIVRKVRQPDGKRRHDLFVNREHWDNQSRAIIAAIKRIGG